MNLTINTRGNSRIAFLAVGLLASLPQAPKPTGVLHPKNADDRNNFEYFDNFYEAVCKGKEEWLNFILVEDSQGRELVADALFTMHPYATEVTLQALVDYVYYKPTTPLTQPLPPRDSKGRFRQLQTILYFDYRGAFDLNYRTRRVRLIKEYADAYFGIDIENGGVRRFLKRRIRPNSVSSHQE